MILVLHTRAFDHFELAVFAVDWDLHLKLGITGLVVVKVVFWDLRELGGFVEARNHVVLQ